MTKSVVAALDIGGTKSAAALVERDGRLGPTASAATPGARGPQAVLDTAAGLVGTLAEAATRAGQRIVGLGVGCAGVIDADAGTVLSATDVLRDWAGTRVAAQLGELSGIPFVRVDNDVHAHALGEGWVGAAADAHSAFFVGVGTGIGASLVIDGRVWHGARSVAGHFGHVPVPHASGLPCVCGGSGHVEAIAAGPAMVEAYNRRAAGHATSLVEVRDLAAAGDVLARLALETGARALGCAIGGAANLVDPSVVVLGGGVVGAGPSWWEPMEAALRGELLPPLKDLPVVPAQLGPSAALVGAARLVWKELS
ncbi:MAG: ROK family protein [Intrasporangium sp.]|uniref:ROK family protein n=1 Tax=Intrasporangium sp. TaxID=1925024 RepID=UPI0026475B59|nr:ROK family protein [Intrasporangium sp.]MDN5797145.1 ROK family protein [Intrasporangium sp.]